MRLMLWIGDEGPTDIDLKDGDVWGWHDNAWVPGTQELKRWLVIETEEYANDKEELVQPEYAPGPTPDANAIRQARKYQVRYWEKLTPAEIADARNPETSVPIMAGRFSLFDILRK